MTALTLLLKDRSEIGDGELFRILRELQREHYDDSRAESPHEVKSWPGMIGKSRNCAEDALDAIDPEIDDAKLAFVAADYRMAADAALAA